MRQGKNEEESVSREQRANSAPLKFLLSFLLGTAFFLMPVYFRGKWTVPFDVFITELRGAWPRTAEFYTLVVVLLGSVFSVLSRWFPRLSRRHHWLKDFQTSSPIFGLRLAGGVLAVLFVLQILPSTFYQAGIYRLIWQVLAVSVALIIPLGAVFVQLFVLYGGMEFLGTLAQPVMWPLFRLPGRAALDALTSWVGSYSVGLYLTRTVMYNGGYNRREAATLATCFSTVSIGFVGVVCATLELLPQFPLVLLFYLLAVVFLAAVLVRIPPLSHIPATYVNKAPERGTQEPLRGSLLGRAWRVALEKARQSPPFAQALIRGVGDGLRLASSIIGTIVSVGTLALMLAKFTPLFHYLGLPLVPVLQFLGIPRPEVVAPAVVVEITEMYIPALLVVNTPQTARFFVAVLSTSQLIFFSSLGPMILDMFRDVPVRFTHLLVLFVLRTLLLLPLLALGVKLLLWVGLLG